MNRSQRRHASHRAKRSGKTKNDLELQQRSRFETDLRAALECENIRLIACVPGQDEKTKEVVWVFTVYAGDPGRFITVQSPRGTLANLATGVTHVVRKQLATGDATVGAEIEPVVELQAPRVSAEKVPVALPAEPARPIEAIELSIGERIRRAELAEQEQGR